jgi:hypothetical protein
VYSSLSTCDPSDIFETIESAIADKAEGKFSIKDKPTAADLSLAQAVYDALPTKVKDALAPLADVSLSRAIVLADELADVLTYLDLLAATLGVDLGRAAAQKFNEVSERVGSTVLLR